MQLSTPIFLSTPTHRLTDLKHHTTPRNFDFPFIINKKQLSQEIWMTAVLVGQGTECSISPSEGFLLCCAAWGAAAGSLGSCARSPLCRRCAGQCRQWQSLGWDISHSGPCSGHSGSALHWCHSGPTLLLGKCCAGIELKALIPGCTEPDQSQPG